MNSSAQNQPIDRVKRSDIAESLAGFKVEKLNAPMKFDMSLLCAFDSLYVNADGPQGTGLYQITRS